MTAAPGPDRPEDLSGKRVVLVAALARNRVIGADGGIPWHLPEDFAHFKRLTMGHTLLMGRATYDSIGRPLPGRTTVVVTRDPDWSPGPEHAAGVRVVHSIREALAAAAELPGDVMVVGGAQVYAQTLPFATHQVLSEVHRTVDGDTFYPQIDAREWVEVERTPDEGFDVVTWERRPGVWDAGRVRLDLRIDPTASTPPFEQVKEQVTAALASGDLVAGDRLPTVRALAADLGLAANTVARSYRDLEAAGVVQTRGRSGTFVAGAGVEREARAAAATYAARVRELGLPTEEAVALVRRALQ